MKPGGRLVMPLGNQDVQMLTVIDKRADNALVTREVIAVRFTQLETSD